MSAFVQSLWQPTYNVPLFTNKTVEHHTVPLLHFNQQFVRCTLCKENLYLKLRMTFMNGWSGCTVCCVANMKIRGNLYTVHSNAVIAWSNITWLYILYDNNWSKICIGCYIHKRHPYLALTGELWGAFCEDLGGNWRRYNGTALYCGNTEEASTKCEGSNIYYLIHGSV